MATHRIEGLDELAEAIRSISHGPTFSTSGEKLEALGLEALGIALAGSGYKHPVGEAIDSHACAVEESGRTVAEALDGIAAAIGRLASAVERRR